MTGLRQEYARDWRLDHFETLAPYLTGANELPYADIAQRWNGSVGAVKVAVHRLRKQYRQLLRQRIAETVAGPDEVNDEVRFLLSALGTS